MQGSDATSVAVVTGAASGIGAALVPALLARGMRVLAVDVDERITGMYDDQRVLGRVCDVSDSEQVAALLPAVLAAFGRVDVLVNNAGVLTEEGPAWELGLKGWHRTVAVNLMGVVHGVRTFVPHLVAQGAGHVVTVCSVGGLVATRGGGNGSYAATKHAVTGFLLTLREDLRAVGSQVAVSLVCPGPVATSLRRNPPARPGSPAHGLATATPEEAAAVVAGTLDRPGELVAFPADTAAYAAEFLERELLAPLRSVAGAG
jgi:NAD(P)-dependent dehydrogenase (short-subunit alcohol dehydrogenase family)